MTLKVWVWQDKGRVRGRSWAPSTRLASRRTPACFNLKPNGDHGHDSCSSRLFLLLKFYHQEKEKAPSPQCLKVRSPPSSCWTNCDVTPGRRRAALAVTPGRRRPRPAPEEELGLRRAGLQGREEQVSGGCPGPSTSGRVSDGERGHTMSKERTPQRGGCVRSKLTRSPGGWGGGESSDLGQSRDRRGLLGRRSG